MYENELPFAIFAVQFRIKLLNYTIRHVDCPFKLRAETALSFSTAEVAMFG